MYRTRFVVGSNHGVRGWPVRGPMGAAFQIGFAKAEPLQPATDAIDMHRLTAVGRTGQGDLVVAYGKRTGRAGFDQRQRLQRLECRTCKYRSLNIAPGGNQSTAMVDDGGRASMHAFDKRAATDFNQHRIGKFAQ